VVIGADTLVDLQGQVLNKPLDRDDAIRMLRLLTGTTHQVHSGLAVWRRGALQTRVVTASVRMRPASEAQIAAYMDTGEPMDKAGAYAAQGQGAALIEAVEGSYLAVVGLPLLALREMLLEAGIPVPSDVAWLSILEREGYA
jgi:septum formation protein